VNICHEENDGEEEDEDLPT
ncbi:unnamed protein product, partial [Onchocerca ochengi]|uniref:Uncharacterized protein n=1 Tax=Onchocerca ochengi TaxID=42157 RepID=A0A182EZR8_ONCOC